MTKNFIREGWEIEWCPFVPEYPNSDDYDLDRKTIKRLHFKTKEEACKKAREVVGTDFFGCVIINEFELTEDPRFPGHYEKEYLGTQEEVTVADD